MLSSLVARISTCIRPKTPCARQQLLWAAARGHRSSPLRHRARLGRTAVGMEHSQGATAIEVAPAPGAPASPAPERQHQARKHKTARAGSPPAADVAAAAADVSESEIDSILLKTSRRKGRKELPTDPAVREAIRRRIAESRVKRAAKLSYNCPACTTVLSRSATLASHAARCCPDILDAKAVQRVRGDAARR